MRHERILVATIALLGACSGAPLPSDMEWAQRMERGGDDAAALDGWRAVLASCPRAGARPKDDCGVAALREAQLLERMGRKEEAAAAYEAVPRLSTESRNAALALSRAATLRLALGQEEHAIATAWRCVEQYPEEHGAAAALTLAVRLERRKDARALRDRLDGMARRLDPLGTGLPLAPGAQPPPRRAALAAGHDNDLLDDLLFHAADLTAVELADAPDAVARYDALAARSRRSSLRDDALWRAAHLLRKTGDGRAATDRLRALLRTRKDALFTGSYNSEFLDDAQLLLGQILRDDLHDTSAAAGAFRTLADDFPESILRDDALHELARTHLAAHTPPTDDDRSRACAALARLLKQFPDGNRARAARALQMEIICPR